MFESLTAVLDAIAHGVLTVGQDYSENSRGILALFPNIYSPIIPELCAIFFRAYYSYNYASIIRPTLLTVKCSARARARKYVRQMVV